MNKFNGMSQIELEMMRDEINKVLPGLLTMVPVFAKLSKSNYDALKKQDFTDNQAMYMAVQSAAKQMGLG
ncbi:hypothetical protein ACFFF5_17890 [Lederbergia wuyishanensis]|uniref:Uncharacterized protein n=1 Tax=Lederbergia wuyishanensis TaxID=1347903 RepID=A0ABU0D4I0_9BACI|nr:hypothetical protein [Lederbergia wuyishanensis]MCJ8008101.1 hypothetical protein [Lederbergia wuyishanensis]MDQ0343313.1 hypothetical protein [Lederbergia wuyishanensis]